MSTIRKYWLILYTIEILYNDFMKVQERFDWLKLNLAAHFLAKYIAVSRVNEQCCRCH